MGDSNIAGKVSLVLITILVVLGVVTLVSSMTSIDTGKVGVVTNYGRVTGRELDEGLSWIAPWGIENVTEYDVKTQKADFAKQDAGTKDLQTVTADITVNYRLERGSVSVIHKKVGQKWYNNLVARIIPDAFKTATAKFTVAESINQRNDLRAIFLQTLRERLEQRLAKDNLTGSVVIDDVSVADLSPSKKYRDAIEARQVAQQNAERAKYNLEQARLDAQSQDVQAKTLTKEYLRLKELENESRAIEKWNGTMPTTVAGNGTIFSIPTQK